MIVWLILGLIAICPSLVGNGERSDLLTGSVLPIGRRSISSAQAICASAEWAVEMKIEANPTPEQLKWIVLVILIAAGLGHEQILGLLA